MSIFFGDKLPYMPTGDSVTPPLTLVHCYPKLEQYFDLTHTVEATTEQLMSRGKEYQNYVHNSFTGGKEKY